MNTFNSGASYNAMQTLNPSKRDSNAVTEHEFIYEGESIHFDDDFVNNGRSFDNSMIIVEAGKTTSSYNPPRSKVVIDIIDCSVEIISTTNPNIDFYIDDANGEKQQWTPEVISMDTFHTLIIDEDEDEDNSNSIFHYVVDLDERGDYYAHIEPSLANGATLWEVDTNGIYQLIEGGFMKSKTDMKGLLQHLIDIELLDEGDTLVYKG